MKLFKIDAGYYNGVPRINIYLLRILFILMAVFVGSISWNSVITYAGDWDPVRAVAFCVWASYSLLAVLGIFYPLRLLMIVIFEIIYKIIWLIIVAFPLWSAGKLEGSSAEEMTYSFVWVLLPIVAMPWRYFFRTYILPK